MNLLKNILNQSENHLDHLETFKYIVKLIFVSGVADAALFLLVWSLFEKKRCLFASLFKPWGCQPPVSDYCLQLTGS